MLKRKGRGMKKKTGKSKAGKSVRDIPRKTVNAKTAKSVKGGVSLSFAKVAVEYKPQ
jgi:hypothetical protein